MRKLARLLALLLVAVSSSIQLFNIPGDFRELGTGFLQQSVAYAGALHAILGLLVVLGAALRRGWAVPMAVAWTIALVYTASIASLAWETQRDGGVIVGAIAAGVSCALVGWWVTWAARQSASRHIPATSESPSSSR